MQSKVDQLISAFETVVTEPWSSALSGQEKIWFLVYDPADQRKVDFRISDFEITTIKANKKWFSISLKQVFPIWLTENEYKEEYFNEPDNLVDALKNEFKLFVINYLISELSKPDIDDDSLVAVTDISSLFGFIRTSEILTGCSDDVKGRLLLFFPGEFDNNHFRLLDARDGWNYLARPITT